MKLSTKKALINKVTLSLLELFYIVDQLLDDTEFNRRVKDQITLTKELLRKSIQDQPEYQFDTNKRN